MWPASRGGRASNHEPSASVTRAAAAPSTAASTARFDRATSRASGEASVAQTSRPASPPLAPRRPGTGRWHPSPSRGPRTPDGLPSPVPPVDRARATRPSSASATSTTCSVSGRGMSTRRSTASSRVRNGQVPSTYWSGSPAARRSASASAASPACSTIQRGRPGRPGRLGVLHDPPGLLHRPDPAPAPPTRSARRAVGVAGTTGHHRPQPSSSWR